MDTLFQYQNGLLNAINEDFRRYLHTELPWDSRFIAIKGLRGVGKSTMLLQHLKYDLKDLNHNLYVTLDHPYFYENGLLELATKFSQRGGQVLLLDEVHKYPNWSREIKMIYDGLPSLQVIFSSSSALDILKGEADLSRRVLVYELFGLSFREYLNLFHGYQHVPLPLEEILENHITYAQDISAQISILAHFEDYIQFGYFPFSKDESNLVYQKRIIQALSVTLSEDMNYINNYSLQDIYNLKKLLAVISNTSPFTINVSKIAAKLKVGRNTLKEFLHALKNAGVLNFINQEGKSTSLLQKPDKIYIENTNFSHVLTERPNKGTLRETFIVNQLKNAGHEISLPKTGDVQIINKSSILYTLEIGGKSKTINQIANLQNGFIVSDDLLIGHQNKIPAWIFGFLY